MPGKKSIFALTTVAVLLIAGIVFFYKADIPELKRWASQTVERFTKSPDAPTVQLPDPVNRESQVSTHPPIVKPVPQPDSQPIGQAVNLPPSPPLPQVPPESGQGERKQAFGLENSVDHIILKDEPFEIAGKTYTIDGIQSEIQKSRTQMQTAGSSAPVGADTPYYGVHIVQPSENVWKIHFEILREYLARRQVILPPNADRPLPGGRSSGVSRLLKFIESVVIVYNAGENRVEKNINLIHPQSFIIFFKISDLFKALDQMQAEDWKWLRYVRGSIRVNRQGQSVEVIDRHSLE
jgi:hypothetical protein